MEDIQVTPVEENGLGGFDSYRVPGIVTTAPQGTFWSAMRGEARRGTGGRCSCAAAGTRAGALAPG